MADENYYRRDGYDRGIPGRDPYDMGMTEREILMKQLEYSRKQASFARVTMIMAIIMALTLGGFCIFTGSRLAATMKNVQVTMDKVNEVDLDALAKDVDNLALLGADGLEQTMGKLAQLDIEELNQAVGELSSAASDFSKIIGPLSRFFGG